MGFYPGFDIAVQGQYLKDVYERYAGELRRYLRGIRRVRDNEAEDIAQTAFLKLAASGQAGEIENPRAFLYTTARNLVVDEVRHRAHVERVDNLHSSPQRHDNDEISPERIALAREQLGIVEQAIRDLPPKRRRIFILSRIQHLSYEQIAQETGLTAVAVKQHVIRSLADCRRALESQQGGRRHGR